MIGKYSKTEYCLEEYMMVENPTAGHLDEEYGIVENPVRKTEIS